MEIQTWLQQIFIHTPFIRNPLPGDAGFRRYERIVLESNSTYILLIDESPAHLKLFIERSNFFASIKIDVPKIIDTNIPLSLALLDDLGAEHLLDMINENNDAHLYRKCFNILQQMFVASRTATLFNNLPVFNISCMNEQLELFFQWYLKIHLEMNLTAKETKDLKDCFNLLNNEITALPYVITHMDFHSRNLMYLKNREEFGVIDFQDAMSAPITYDLVSLLKDCYYLTNRQKVINLVDEYYNLVNLNSNSIIMSSSDFLKAFDLTGVQRHLKVLGIFSRLFYRDKKSQYLPHIPLILSYVMEVSKIYPILEPLNNFFSTKIGVPCEP